MAHKNTIIICSSISFKTFCNDVGMNKTAIGHMNCSFLHLIFQSQWPMNPCTLLLLLEIHLNEQQLQSLLDYFFQNKTKNGFA